MVLVQCDGLKQWLVVWNCFFFFTGKKRKTRKNKTSKSNSNNNDGGSGGGGDGTAKQFEVAAARLSDVKIVHQSAKQQISTLASAG